MSNQDTENQYLVLDSGNEPLARAMLESRQDAPALQFEVLDGKADAVMAHEQLRFLPMADGKQALLGRVVRCRGERITVEKLQRLDSELRQNLRMHTSFETLIYPISGSWKGRRWVESNDLSCGGIAFFSRFPLEERERFELVVPITAQPLLLRSEIIRKRPCSREGEEMYAAKFVDMCHDEEMMVREAVFNVQLSSRPRRAGTKEE